MSALDRLSDSERANLASAAFPDWTAPMLAVLTHHHFSDPGWVFERKLDGERALAFCRGDCTRLLTRNRKDIGGTYPEIVDALAQSVPEDAVLDGEIVAFDGRHTSFARLQSRMQIKDAAKARRSPIDVWFYLFDILHLGGQDLARVPLRGRKKVLKALIGRNDPLRFTPHRNVAGEKLFAEACRKGWEGVIAKRADAPYAHSRSTDWLKFKCTSRQELVIGGFTEPKGDREGFGALLVGYYDGADLRYAGKVGTGYSDVQLRRLRKEMEGMKRRSSPFSDETGGDGAHWVNPQLVAEIGFTEWTKSGKLRHPRFLGLRDDKDPEDVGREVAR